MCRSIIKLATIVYASSLLVVSVAHSADDARSDNDKVFYYLGTQLGGNVKNLSMSDREIEQMFEGLRDTLTGDAEQLNQAIYGQKLNEVAGQRMAAFAAKEKAASNAYLEKLAAEDGAITTDTGIVYLEIKPGTGVQATRTSSVETHYHGTLRDGTVFDSSKERGQTLKVPLNQVVPCWTEAIAMMKEGGISKITCPPETAYGDQERGNIPPGSVLTFEVELIAVLPEAG
ncbi:MAG: FKBP-type peptidyl-prolyl cis-trans isomerase [Gammaproteobacteria bacterium]